MKESLGDERREERKLESIGRKRLGNKTNIGTLVGVGRKIRRGTKNKSLKERMELRTY